MHHTRYALLLCYLACAAAAAGQAPDSAPPALPLAPVPPAVPAPPPTDTGPTEAQKRYLDGLRTAARGVAQLKDGVDRTLRTRGDTARHRLATQRLGGLCGTARGFLARGRARMSPAAYEDSVRVLARQLVIQIDSVAAYLPACQQRAARYGLEVAEYLVARLRSYEAALQRWRAVTILPPSPVAPVPSQP